MEKITLFFIISIVLFSSCDATLAALQGMSNGLNECNQTAIPTNQTGRASYIEKEWNNCSSCQGSGRCEYCYGSGKNEYAKFGRCGVCRGTGRCVGCNGKGGYFI